MTQVVEVVTIPVPDLRAMIRQELQEFMNGIRPNTDNGEDMIKVEDIAKENGFKNAVHLLRKIKSANIPTGKQGRFLTIKRKYIPEILK